MSPFVTRRTFLGAAASSAALAFGPKPSPARAAIGPTPGGAPGIIDVFVDLFEWPFRSLPDTTPSGLRGRLSRHRVRQAWAGSHEAMLHKNLARVNERLAEACRAEAGFLLPFGAVNPAYPDWEEDLRRCHEVHRMPGIRLYPRYHGYTLEDPRFERLLALATERGLIVQVVVMLEDIRMQHPLVEVPPVELDPLVGILPRHPRARVVLLNIFNHYRQARLRALVEQPQIYFELSNLDGVGAIELLLKGEHWYYGAKLPLDRILFGSHAPYYPLENALFKLFESRLTVEEFNAIAASNAERLLRQT